MRLDPLGESRIQVPRVYWVPRSWPRKNVMALLELHPSGMGVTAPFVRKGLDVSSCRMDDGNLNKVLEAKSTPEQTPQPVKRVVAESKKETSTKLGQNMGAKNMWIHLQILQMIISLLCQQQKVELEGTVKTHLAGTLSEVLKLVEGVSKYGAGRCSEIRRLAFASDSYRASVDLNVC